MGSLLFLKPVSAFRITSVARCCPNSFSSNCSLRAAGANPRIERKTHVKHAPERQHFAQVAKEMRRVAGGPAGSLPSRRAGSEVEAQVVESHDATCKEMHYMQVSYKEANVSVQLSMSPLD